MKKQPPVDGFIPRRSPGTVGGGLTHDARLRGVSRPAVTSKASEATRVTIQPTDESSVKRQAIYRSDIDASLRDIDEQGESVAPIPKRVKTPHPKKHRWVKRVVLLVLVASLLGVGWVGLKAVLAGQSVFNGDIFGLIQQKKLQQDAKGRTNVLLFGTSEDDPGHEGANLTDSIMVLSVDQTKKDAYMMSIPRDLRVEYGRTCSNGAANKINAYYTCVADGDSKAAEQERQTALRKMVGEIVGLDIQYSVHVNYSVVRDIVGALGTITVNIEGSGGAPGVMDSNFDWKCKGGNAYASLATMKKNCPPNGHFIDYPNGPAVLDAEHALYLAQARGDIEPTYGLGRSNFDRELNQQKIIKAIKEKAMSTGTLTNIVTVTNLMDAMGSNLRTNFDTTEIRTLITLAKDIPNTAVQSISLVDATPALFGSAGGDVVPAAGMYDYSDIQSYIQRTINATPVTKEAAHVIVLNASGVTGAARIEANKLESLGMIVDGVDNLATTEGLTQNQFYQTGKDKTYTEKALATRYGTKVLTSAPPITALSTTDFIIVLVKPIEAATPVTP